MYQKSALGMTMLYLCAVLCSALCCTKGIQIEKVFAGILQVAEQDTEAFYQIEEQRIVTTEYNLESQSGQSVEHNLEIACQLLQKEYVISLSETDYQTLLCIVEAEAGGEDYTGKLLVADVVINRVKSDKFPNTVQQVVYQKDGNVSQFTPVSDGRIHTVTVSDETRMAVEDALYGEDISNGALYFANRKSADPARMSWFDERLTNLFCYGGHEFFR